MSLEEFREYYEALGKKVIKPYYYLLRKFENYLKEKGKSLDDMAVSDIQLFLAKLAREQNPRTANVFLNAVRKYIEWRISTARDDDEFMRLQRFYWQVKNVRPVKVPREIKKEALTLEELEKLIMATIVSGRRELFAGTIIHFYYGWRPAEGSVHLAEAEIDWDERYMIIKTAKVGNERVLPWVPELDPVVRTWYDFVTQKLVKMSGPSEWFTKTIKRYSQRVLGMKVTARTARKTFETQMRRQGVEQWVIDFVLGHATRVPDIYTDWTVALGHIRQVFESQHYMNPLLVKVRRWVEWLGKKS